MMNAMDKQKAVYLHNKILFGLENDHTPTKIFLMEFCYCLFYITCFTSYGPVGGCALHRAGTVSGRK